VFIEHKGVRVLVDAGPDFRYQMLREGITGVDAILLTHNHKDHTGGLDDIRAFNYHEKKATQIYCEKYVEDALRMEYSYAFAEKKYPGAPEWNVNIIDDKPFYVNGIEIIPIRGMHYRLPVLGYRFGDIAYCTDMNHIPEEEFAKLQGLEHFIINCVRRGHHISHFSLEEAVATATKVGARHSWLTHLSHQLPSHEELMQELPDGIQPAYDGLTIEL
jgi:phosphoribosyl 1,2-cyclic phosphate phosphodiesterase